MPRTYTCVAFLVAAVSALAAPPSANVAAAASRTLWQIGTPDGSYGEFAIAGHFADYARSFPRDVTYRIGSSKSSADWPYVHPGTFDPWAGAKPHPFNIDFDLTTVPKTPCRLNVYLVDARHESPEVLEIDVNGRRKYRFVVVPGAGEESLTDPGAGRQSAVQVPFSRALLQPGHNRITLTAVNACWLLYDAVSLETGPAILATPELVEASAHTDAAGGPVTVAVNNIGTEGDAELRLVGSPQQADRVHVLPGPNTFTLAVPPGLGDGPLQVAIAAGGRTQTIGVQTPQVLWRIGQADHDYREFAIAGHYPEYTRRFPHDVTYNLDTSRPERDWPFIHPGPTDAWAGVGAHPFRIEFSLPSAPTCSACLNVNTVDTQPLGGPMLEVSINGRGSCRRQLPSGGSDDSLIDAAAGHACKLEIPIAAGLLQAGRNEITLTIVRGSWLTYDDVSLVTGVGLPDGPRVEGIAACTTPLFRRVNGELRQVVRVTTRNTGVGGEVEVQLRGGTDVRQTASLAPGENIVDVLIPPIERATPVEATLHAGSRDPVARFVAQPERHWKVFVGPSTHTDIGYTDWQERVYARHNENTAGALRACDAAPAFKWNLEVGYQGELFRTQGTPEFRALLARIKEGRIGLGALYLNMLTGLCSGEELARAVTEVQALAREAGGEAEAANLTDVPTAVGTLPMLLSQSGVRYFADGANDSIPFAGGGRQIDQSPYWWEGLDGSRVLAITARQYAQAGTLGLLDDVPTMEQRLPGWLRQIGRDGYPGDAAYVYGAFGDNQPMVPRYADVAAAWNARWEYPQIIIGRMDEFFHHVEDNVGKQLPVVHGDFGVQWEDGAASSALETAMVRRAKVRLDAAERWHALVSIAEPKTPFPAEAIRTAWDQVLLFDEHTWGAACSVSDPESEQTRHQWAVKAAFAQEAARRSEELLNSGLQACRPIGDHQSKQVEPAPDAVVFNEQSWPRDIVASCPVPAGGTGVRVTATAGDTVPCQVEGDRVVFIARQVPSLGWKSYRVEAAVAPEPAPAFLRKGTDAWSWETPDFRLRVDPATGALSSLYDKTVRAEWVGSAAKYGLNQFLYALRHKGAKTYDPTPPTVFTHTSATAQIAMDGPVRAALRITRTGPDAPATDTYLILGPGRRIEFLNMVHKAPTLANEAGYFAFPFRISTPGAGRAFVELPYGAMEVGRDQSAGACRDWYATNSFAAVSDGRLTASLATPHAPMLTFNDIHREGQPTPGAPFSGTVFAWVMSNRWDTNYKASQGGDMVFSFVLDLHSGAFDPVAATRFGWDALATMADPARGDAREPWSLAAALSVPGRVGDTSAASLLQVSGEAVVVGNVTRSGKLLQVRIYNPSSRRSDATISLPGRRVVGAWSADLTGAPKSRLSLALDSTTTRVTVPARGLVTVLLQASHIGGVAVQ